MANFSPRNPLFLDEQHGTFWLGVIVGLFLAFAVVIGASALKGS